jgi:hypothetical protein
MTRPALDTLGDLKRLHQALDRTFAVLMEEARAEGYTQALIDCEAATRQGLPALRLLLATHLPPRPVGQEVEREGERECR